MLDQREALRPLVVELIPLGIERKPSIAFMPPSPFKRQLPATSFGAASERPAVVVKPVALASVVTVSKERASASSLAPAGGAPAVASGAQLDAYQRQLYEIVARNSRYPAEAKRLGLSGVTHLAFRLDRQGNVVESWVQETSGSELLDDAALKP